MPAFIQFGGLKWRVSWEGEKGLVNWLRNFKMTGVVAVAAAAAAIIID